MTDTGKCADCARGNHFEPRPDEVVMGCNRPGWEGYTTRESTCEAFTPQPDRNNGVAP